jgi:DNA-binding Xre family transcriptional regulator
MKWNLRLAGANGGIWKASELQRLLAARGMVISAGKMSGLWSGQPNTIKLDELDVICAVLGCDVSELLLAEPETVPQPKPGSEQATAAGETRHATPRPRGGQVTAASVTCTHCGRPLTGTARRDRIYCNNSCSALVSCYRRKNAAAPPPRWQHPALESANPALRAGRRSRQPARQDPRLVTVHHPVRHGRPGSGAGRPPRRRAHHAHRDPDPNAPAHFHSASRQSARRAWLAGRRPSEPGSPIAARPGRTLPTSTS